MQPGFVKTIFTISWNCMVQQYAGPISRKHYIICQLS